MEESKESSVYEDYKFVTRCESLDILVFLKDKLYISSRIFLWIFREELSEWGLNHMIGTNLLKAYMHGFYMDMRLYNRVKAIAEPDAYEKYIKSKVDERLNKRLEGAGPNFRLP